MESNIIKEFKISEVSHFYDMTPRTLRYYEELKLLKPCRIDPKTSYRFYGKQAIKRLEIIIQLKNMGLSLDEIHSCLIGRLSILDRIENCKIEIQKMNFKLKELEFLTTKSNKYVANIFEFPNRITLSRETRSVNHSDMIEKFYGFISDMIERKIKLMPLKRYFFELSDGKFADGNPLVRMHANISVDKYMPKEAGLFRGRKFLRTCHKGKWQDISKAFEFLLDYADSNGMKLGKPAIITYVNGTFFTDDENNLVQVGLPII